MEPPQRCSDLAPRTGGATPGLHCSGGALMEHGRGSNQVPCTGEAPMEHGGTPMEHSGAPMEHGGAPITLHALGEPQWSKTVAPTRLHLAMERGWGHNHAPIEALPV